jgi:hypothetical protein
MSFEDDEYWDEEYSDHSATSPAAVVRQRQFTRRTAPDPVIPTRRGGQGPRPDSLRYEEHVDELAARRQRRTTGHPPTVDRHKPPQVFDAQRPSWLDDPAFVPVDTSAPDLAGDDFADVDFNRPELAADFDSPEFPVGDRGVSRPADPWARSAGRPDDIDEPYDHRAVQPDNRSVQHASRSVEHDSGAPGRDDRVEDAYDRPVRGAALPGSRPQAPAAAGRARVPQPPPQEDPREQPHRSPRTARVILSADDGPWSVVPDAAPPAPRAGQPPLPPVTPQPVASGRAPTLPEPPEPDVRDPGGPIAPQDGPFARSAGAAPQVSPLDAAGAGQLRPAAGDEVRLGAHAQPYMDADGVLHNLKPIARLTVSGSDAEPPPPADTGFGGLWFTAKTEQAPEEPEPGRLVSDLDLTGSFPRTRAEPERDAPAVPAEDLRAIRWRLDGGTLREVVENRDALRELGDRLDGPLAEEADNAAKAGLLSVRAEVYRLLGELGMAAAASRLALAHAESARDVPAMVIAQAELAHVLRLRGDFKEADRLFARAAGAPVPAALRSVVHENAGRSCFDQGRHLEALDHFGRAVQLGRPDDGELAERIGVCLEAVYIHVLRDGWGPYPRRGPAVPG